MARELSEQPIGSEPPAADQPRYNPFGSESQLFIDGALNQPPLEPGAYAKAGLAALALAAGALTPWGRKAMAVVGDCIKDGLRLTESKASDAAGEPAAGELLGYINGFRERRDNVRLDKAFARMSREAEDAVAQGKVGPESLGALRGLVEIVGNKPGADADLIAGAKLMAFDSARFHNPGLDWIGAEKLVQSLSAYPASAEAARKVPEFFNSQDAVIRLSHQLSGTKDGLATAKTLSERAAAYEQLGRPDRALVDLFKALSAQTTHGILHGAEPHSVLYQRSQLLERLGMKDESERDLFEAGQWLGQLHAVREGVAPGKALGFVWETKAYPARGESALPRPELGETLHEVVNLSLQLKARPIASAETVEALTRRSDLYRQLGHSLAARKDTELAGTLSRQLEEERREAASMKPFDAGRLEKLPAAGDDDDPATLHRLWLLQFQG